MVHFMTTNRFKIAFIKYIINTYPCSNNIVFYFTHYVIISIVKKINALLFIGTPQVR